MNPGKIHGQLTNKRGLVKMKSTLAFMMAFIVCNAMAEELKANGIEVKASRKGQDGMAHISVCGASTGNLNVYTIGKASLSKAQELGFKLLISRAMTSEIRGWAPARRGGPQARVMPRSVGSAAAPIPRLW
jgi:hypothetical protein